MSEASRNRILSGGDVRVSAAPVRVGVNSPFGANGTPSHQHGDTDGAPQVKEVRDAAGNVTQIHVQCACGQTTVIECEYA